MKSFDVVIIGGGLGGLSCGAILSKEGLGVCVLEKHSVVGGCLQSFRREGRTLDTGMHYVGSLSEGQIMHQYLKYFGVIDSLRLQKLDENGFDEFHFKDGTSYCHAMGYENFIETLASQFPGERSGLKTLCKTIQDIGDLISPEILLEGKLSADGIKYMSESAYQEIRKHLRSEKLRNVLAGNCRLYGGEKSVTSLYEYGMVTHSNIQGAYAFVDGSQQLADALAEVIRSNGGEVCPNSEVLKIRLEANTVEYVETRDGERLQGKYIISSLHPVVTFSLLENNTVYKKAFFTRINSLKNTHGIFSTYLLTKRGTLKYVNRNNYMFNTQDVWATEGHYKGFNIPSVLMCMQPNHLSEHGECGFV
jgi:all-trans-retinol 13,14-reductase